ncbi:hypothetical protein VNO80_08219 [Phaseolus coccineus]|uniref:Legume lectin domain-containing protein n=1 Tax=Phaseolus coccineus TaxID=3886 RepID=A0AAN9RG14_PHACN
MRLNQQQQQPTPRLLLLSSLLFHCVFNTTNCTFVTALGEHPLSYSYSYPYSTLPTSFFTLSFNISHTLSSMSNNALCIFQISSYNTNNSDDDDGDKGKHVLTLKDIGNGRQCMDGDDAKEKGRETET